VDAWKGYLSLVALAMSLLDCAEQCERVSRAFFMASSATRGDTELRRTTILAIAAMQAAATTAILEGEARAEALRVVIRNARQAREVLATRGLDRDLMVCVECCERAESLAAAALYRSDGSV
jgi:hypothetical protein